MILNSNFLLFLDICSTSFNDHAKAACILYDASDCNGEKGLKEMVNDEALSDIEKSQYFDVASISIREGCQLIVDTG